MITALYRRNILPGTKYNDLIPSSECHSLYKGNGDTYHSMDLIKDFIVDYSYQVEKLAPLLLGNTLQRTVANIYDFLYNHIQYKADGAAQEIRSPQCAWHTRDRGTDCKSYSVFAGAICKELGLPFSIRKIQQSTDSPGNYSHVYIIVHDKSTYHVIDATKHENTESSFIKKYDVSMKHYGLNASIADEQKHCAFHDYFGRICDTLTENGACSKQVNTLKNKVNDHIKETGAYPLVNVNVDTVYINSTPHTFRGSNGATVLVATKRKGLNSSAAAAGAALASGALKDGAGKILAKVKGSVGKIWKSITCKLRSSAWNEKMVKAYDSAIQSYFEQIINKLGNQPTAYYVPNNLGESQFTKDLNRHILEFWSENAKYEFENNTFGKGHNSCSKIAREAAIRITEEYYKGIMEVYSLLIDSGYPVEHHMVITSPLMNFAFNDLYDFNQTVDKARKEGHKMAVPQIQLPKVTVNVEELAKLENKRPNIPGNGLITAPSIPGNNSGGGNTTNPPSTGGGSVLAPSNPNTGGGNISNPNFGNIAQTQKPKQAGFGIVPALLIAAAGYGVIQSQSKKKKK